MDKVLVIAPQAGMGNRFRALCSALVLGEYTGRIVYHTWYDEALSSSLAHVKDMQQVGYSGLFTELVPRWTGQQVVDECYSEWLPMAHWYASQSSGQTRFAPGVPCVSIAEDATSIVNSTANVILLETSHVVAVPGTEWTSRMSAMYGRYFSPRPEYTRLALQAEIGISVRRGDLLHYYPEARQDLLRVAAWLLPRISEKEVVIFSDDFSVRQALRTVLGSTLSLGDSDGWQRGFIEFLTLARCSQVYGTPASSFAKEAAVFGGVPYAIIQEEE